MLNTQDILGIARVIARFREAPLSLSELSAHTGWSESHLQRSFAQQAGESPKRFHQRLQLNEAAARLTLTDDTILDVAVATGHRSHEAFVRAFRRQFACTPSEYKRRAAQIAEPSREPSRNVHAGVVRTAGPCTAFFRTDPSLNERSLNMPTSEPVRISVETRPILFIRKRAKQSDLQSVFAECFPRLFGHCIENAIPMAGHPMARYIDFTPGMVTVDCIIPLQAPSESSADMEAGELPSGPVAFATHTGPYDSLPETYGVIEQWMEDGGMQRGGPHWEWYVTDPGEVPDPNEWQTEVYIPLAT